MVSFCFGVNFHLENMTQHSDSKANDERDRVGRKIYSKQGWECASYVADLLHFVALNRLLRSNSDLLHFMSIEIKYSKNNFIVVLIHFSNFEERNFLDLNTFIAKIFYIQLSKSTLIYLSASSFIYLSHFNQVWNSSEVFATNLNLIS